MDYRRSWRFAAVLLAPALRVAHRFLAPGAVAAALVAISLPASVATTFAASAPVTGTAACKLAGTTGWEDEGHQTDYRTFLRPAGTLHAVMLFVDFPDAPAAANPAPYDSTSAYADFFAPSTRWLHRASYGRASLDITPINRWYRMSQPMAAYGMTRGMTFANHAAYLREAVSLADSDVDFRAYDLVYVVVARNATAITTSPGFIDTTNSIPADGTFVTHGATFGQDIWAWGANGYRVLDHETSHTFGLPDLYAFTPINGDFHPYAGQWDVMNQISSPAPDFFGWERWKLGWLNDSQVDCVTAAGTTTHRLTALERRGGTKIVVVPTGPTTAIVAESRRATGNDAATCSTGVLIYTIDTSTPTGEGPVRVIDATPGDPATASCTDLDIATFGGSRPTTFSRDGMTITVTASSRTADVVTLTRS